MAKSDVSRFVEVMVACLEAKEQSRPKSKVRYADSVAKPFLALKRGTLF